MIENLASWLEKQGFSLEMRAASKFRQAGFQVKQSAHYHDRGLGKDREIDVVANLTQVSGDALVHLAVECKSSDKPWVVLISPNALDGIDPWLSWGLMTHAGVDTFASGGVVSPDELPWYTTSSECGYSLRKAFTDRDDGFAASAAVCKAAQYLVLPMQADHRQLPTYAIAFPVIVVDAPIVECRLDSEGRIQLTEVRRSQYLFEDHAMFDAWVRIHIVHIDELQNFANEAYAVAADVQRALAEFPAPRSAFP